METIVIFAGGDQPSPDLLEELPQADSILAADGGYDIAVAFGFKVDVLVGDLDSIAADLIPRDVMVERHPVDKDATDLELALELAARESPDRVVVAGGGGGRLDHELAVAALLCSPRWGSIAEIDWLSGRGRAHVVTSHRRIHGDVKAKVSLLAFGGPATGVETKGFKWDLKGETIHPGSTRGVSNELVSPVGDIRIGQGCLLAIFPTA
ncbi:MAG: thiamine diphosphokinase [Acidimicrobiia bacterium]|nr:thiamine diphosphokinase [Acidimicrobiia bacterium]